MGHNLARFLDGTYMALYVDTPAWHNLGEVVTSLQTAKEIAKKVFHNRIIETVPAYAKVGKKIVEVPEFRALADSSTGAIYAFSSDQYQPIQDLDALNVMQALVQAAGATGKAKALFGSAGALGNGARGFASIDLTRVLPADCIAIKGDPSKQEAWLFGTWAHDATGALNVGRYRQRVECQNLLNAATASASRAGKLVSIRHTGDKDSMTERLHEAERILSLVEEDFRLNARLLSQLNEIHIPKFEGWLKDFTEVLVPIPDTMERRASRVEARELIRDITLHSKTMVGVPKDTAYRAYQGVAEYADHFRKLRVSADNGAIVPEKRFRAITEGPAADLKATALELIRQEFEVPVMAVVR